MKKLLLIIFLAYSGLLTAQTKEAKLQQLFEAYNEAGNFNGSVLVAQGGKVLLDKGYGFKNVKDSIANDPATIFQLGSLAKQFTAAAILKLQEQKKLNVQDKLNKYFPDYPKGDSITLEHLLTHTSGIFNYTNDPAFMQSEAVKPIIQDRMISLFKNKPLDFSPGSKWSYSNSGYMLLGYIIEKVAKKPYEQYVREIILGPLGMNSSGFDFANRKDPRKATGYHLITKSNAIEAGVVDSSVSYAAGSIYSTTGDLYKWHKGLLEGKVIQQASVEKAFTPYKDKYGYGWIIDQLNGKKVVMHGGGIFGFNTFLSRVPEDDIFIVLLNNVSNGKLSQITRDAYAILYDQPYQLPQVRKEISLAPEVLAKYVGVYELAPQFSITVTVEGNSIFTQATGQSKVQIYPQSEDLFFLKVVDAQLEFKKDETGKVISMTLHQGGRSTVGKKVN